MVNACHNTTVYHKAVYSESNKVLQVYAGSHLNDTVVEEVAKELDFANDAYCNISTVALDDFVEHFDLPPKLIKMDIEGAEFSALQGCKKVIEKYKPIFILEQTCQDDRCILLLLSYGYVAIDLSNFNEVKSKNDFPKDVGISNVLFVHKDKIHETPYQLPITKKLMHTLHQSDFKVEGDRLLLKNSMMLDVGRYYIALDVKTPNPTMDMMMGVQTNGIQMFRYHGGCQFLLNHYNEWIVDVPTQLPIDIYFKFLSHPQNVELQINNIHIYKTSLESSAKNHFGLCTPQSSTW
jgi:FkbM family methyltransferase